MKMGTWTWMPDRRAGFGPNFYNSVIGGAKETSDALRGRIEEMSLQGFLYAVITQL